MKYTTLKQIGFFFALAAGLAVSSGAVAHGDADKPGVATSTEAQVTIPDTAGGIWQAVDAKNADLKKTIDSGTLANVHHEAYAIRDLVAALPAHSPDLAADKKTKVQADVKFVATLAERLDAAGDASDKASAQSNYAKLVKVLGDLRGNYGAAKAP